MRKWRVFGSTRPVMWAVAMVALSVNPAFAGQADVCYSAPVASARVDKLSNSTALDCPSAGRHTLPQLAEAGWSVVAVQPVVVSYNYEAGAGTPQSANSWMVVVQKGTK